MATPPQVISLVVPRVSVSMQYEGLTLGGWPVECPANNPVDQNLFGATRKGQSRSTVALGVHSPLGYRTDYSSFSGLQPTNIASVRYLIHPLPSNYRFPVYR